MSSDSIFANLEAAKQAEQELALELEQEAKEQEEEQQATVKAKSVDTESSIIRKGDADGSKVPLWLITFTDVMALMLTFFVLLYSMSTPREQEWEKVSKGLTQKSNLFNAANYRAGSQDAISIDKVNSSRALDLGYIKTLMGSLLAQKQIKGVVLIENEKRLVISLPSDLLFKSGQVEIGEQGKEVLFEVGGVLTRVKNHIEVIGHSDPVPVNSSKGIYKTNWQLSLARAASVAFILEDVGYDRDIVIRGLSSARFDELPKELPQEERYALSRRVDIVIMRGKGYRMNAFDM